MQRIKVGKCIKFLNECPFACVITTRRQPGLQQTSLPSYLSSIHVLNYCRNKANSQYKTS
jgi:hypothetical protein